MSAARTLLLTEQDLHSRTTDMRDRLNSLAMFLGAVWRVRDAMRKGRPLNDASEILERLKVSLKRDNSGVSNAGYPNPKFFAGAEVPRVVSTEKKASMIGVFGNFKIEATPLLSGSRILGWRITTNDQTTSLRHEFYVSEGRIHHVQFQSSPPWNHSSQFVVGGKVRRIMEAEKRAILRAISNFNAGVSDNG
jgi:hypothetical protein